MSAVIDFIFFSSGVKCLPVPAASQSAMDTLLSVLFIALAYLSFNLP